MDQRTKNLFTNIQRDPWIVLDWKSCHSTEIADLHIRLIDDAIFERDFDNAVELCVILRGLARKMNDDHLKCKAEACCGSLYRLLRLFELAIERIRNAEELAGTCDDCLGAVYKRWAAISAYQDQYNEALKFYDSALGHFQRENKGIEICDSLLGRSIVRRFAGQNSQGLEDALRAVGLMTPEMPPRFFVAGAVNILSLAVACNDDAKSETALVAIKDLRQKLKGVRMPPRVLGVLRWVRGLAFEQLRDITNAVYWLESAVSTFDRLDMKEEQKATRADLARIRKKGKQKETNNRHIIRLIEQSLLLDVDEETEKILLRAKKNPSEENILAWRNCLSSYVPSLEPEPEKKILV